MPATPISLPKGYQRLDAFPLDASNVFATLADLQTYASTNGTAYAGQVCAVTATGLLYVIKSDKSLSQIDAAHAANHATGGSDPITPASIGAATAAQGAKADTALQSGTAISNISGLQTALDGKQASGSYATLVGGLVPSTQLPSYVDDVLEYAALADFPATGETGKIYVATGTGKIYRWSGTAYIEISPSPGSTDAVPEGSTNLYFTTSRASAAAPVQSVAGRTGAVTLTKTDVGLDNVPNTDATLRSNHTGTQLAATISDFAATVLATVLSGLSTATNATISATDTVLSAIGKLQKQVTDNLATLTSHTGNTSNPHSVTKAQVGLGNCDNTSDSNKPVSSAQQTALDGKQIKTIYSDTAPASPTAGLEWVDTTELRSYRYYNNLWVEIDRA